MANFVVKAEINGVEKAAEVVTNANVIATFEGVGYCHSVDVATFDINKIYDLEGNELESEPQDNTPYIKNVGFAGSKWFGAVNVKANGSNVVLSTGGEDFGNNLTEGAVEGLTDNFNNAYVKINEDGRTGTLYFNFSTDIVGEPVNQVQLEKAKLELENEFASDLSELDTAKQDSLKPIEIGKNTLTFNELRQLLAKSSAGQPLTNVCVIKTLSGKIYQVMVGQYATSGAGNPLYIVNFIELNSFREIHIYRKDVYDINQDMLSSMYQYGFVPTSSLGLVHVSQTSGLINVVQEPSDTSKNYVLKLVNGSITWVEETA
jgi:hypothetical protein